MSDKLPLALRSARMSILGRALADPLAIFPLTLEFPGGAGHAQTERSFADRAELERTLIDAEVNAVNDGLAVYRTPDGGFLLAERAAADPWNAAAAAPSRGWLGLRRGWSLGRAHG